MSSKNRIDAAGGWPATGLPAPPVELEKATGRAMGIVRYDPKRRGASDAPPRVSASGTPTSTIENVDAFSIARNTIICMVALLSLLNPFGLGEPVKALSVAGRLCAARFYFWASYRPAPEGCTVLRADSHLFHKAFFLQRAQRFPHRVRMIL